VLIIEHNLDIIKVSDWIIDLGPEGGDRGGELVAQGTPEEICEDPKSFTGQYMKHILNCKHS
jgi:excinuclease ABC subunit A